MRPPNPRSQDLLPALLAPLTTTVLAVGLTFLGLHRANEAVYDSTADFRATSLLFSWIMRSAQLQRAELHPVAILGFGLMASVAVQLLPLRGFPGGRIAGAVLGRHYPAACYALFFGLFALGALQLSPWLLLSPLALLWGPGEPLRSANRPRGAKTIGVVGLLLFILTLILPPLQWPVSADTGYDTANPPGVDDFEAAPAEEFRL